MPRVQAYPGSVRGAGLNGNVNRGVLTIRYGPIQRTLYPALPRRREAAQAVSLEKRRSPRSAACYALEGPNRRQTRPVTGITAAVRRRSGTANRCVAALSFVGGDRLDWTTSPWSGRTR